MRLIDTMSQTELDMLTLKGMLGSRSQTERTGSAPTTTKMPQTVTLKPAKNGEKKHSRVFEATTENDVVKSIYFLRPYADGVNEIKLTVTRNIDAIVDSM